MKLIEKVQSSLEESKEEAKKNGIMYFSYEEFFEYFEIITLVVLMDSPAELSCKWSFGTVVFSRSELKICRF